MAAIVVLFALFPYVSGAILAAAAQDTAGEKPAGPEGHGQRKFSLEAEMMIIRTG